jgi:hypothetical protein
VAQPYIVNCQLPPSLDLEGSYLQSNFTPAQLTAWVQSWMTTVENATGIRPVLYISPSNSNYVNSSLNIYPLWVDYLDWSSTTSPPNIGVWNTWSFKQYDWYAHVAGIPGNNTDLNVFNGNMTAFTNWIGCNVTGVNPPDRSGSFVIYPNPTNGSFTIAFPEAFPGNGTEIVIYDMLEKKVYAESLSSTQTEIDLSSLSKGVYLVKVVSEGQLHAQKIVIQ